MRDAADGEDTIGQGQVGGPRLREIASPLARVDLASSGSRVVSSTAVWEGLSEGGMQIATEAADWSA